MQQSSVLNRGGGGSEVIRVMTENFLCFGRQGGIDPHNQNPADDHAHTLSSINYRRSCFSCCWSKGVEWSAKRCYVGLVAVGVQEQAGDILVPPLLRNCLTLMTFPFPSHHLPSRTLVLAIHRESKKQDTKLLPNINRFSFFFAGRLSGKFATKRCLKIPHHTLNMLLHYLVKYDC